MMYVHLVLFRFTTYTTYVLYRYSILNTRSLVLALATGSRVIVISRAEILRF